MNWHQILPHVWLFRDSCNVYALQGSEGFLVVNAGTGRWLEARKELPAPVVALAMTHYFRDHAAGAAAAARARIPVWVPEYEREIFQDPAEHFRRRETYILYDNVWDLFAPIEPAPLAGVLRDYEILELAGLQVEVVPLPGVTISQSGLAIGLDGQKIVCCGETIHSPGRVARVAPWQYNYNDLPGAVNCYASAQTLRERGADVLLTSLGEPITEEIDDALAQLQTSIRVLTAGRPEMATYFEAMEADSVVPVTPHVWQSLHSGSINWFLVSQSGKCLALDYGYPFRVTPMPSPPSPSRRRALLHSLDGLQKHAGVEKIDVVLVSHFHDDHVAGIPLLQRLFQTECWATENFADLLENPAAHRFPCNWPQKIQVNRRLKMNEIAEWEEFRFHFGPMSGHTRFASLIGFEADGKRFAHTGDQYFFQDKAGHFAQPPGAGEWGDKIIAQNHVYNNGALLEGYFQSAKWMLEWRPDIVLTGHALPMHTDADFFRILENWAEEYAAIHRQIMPLGAEDTHFNLDSMGGWIWPYRTHLPEPGTAKVRVTARNPLPHRAVLELQLVGPFGWTGTSATVEAEGRAEIEVELEITPNGNCRRQPFALDLVADGRPSGQIAEALMTVGGTEF